MLKFRRVCVPLNLDCNLHCRYCYRDKEKLDSIPEFTEDMKEFLGNLRPSFCESVIASGGEPMFHWDKVKELFSYVPKDVHKKVMSNCTLITPEIVDYLNENEVELQLSHDGPKTKFLRGVDVLANKKTRDLLHEVNIIRCFGVVTRYNTDCWENYFDTISKLGRIDVQYDSLPLCDVPAQHDLIEGFDYEQWFTTWMQVRLNPWRYQLPWYDGMTLTEKEVMNTGKRFCGLNILPNGTVCGMVNICSVYGTIHAKSHDEYFENLVRCGDMDYCIKEKCKFIDTCQFPPQGLSSHICKWRKMIMERWTEEKAVETHQYVVDHWDEIKEKYGYKG